MNNKERINHEESAIEIHSEKVRKLLGEMPKSLMILGIVVISAVFLALIGAVCLLPYPYSNGESILLHLLQSL